MKIVALDIGGTAIKSCLFENGELLERREIPSNAELGGPHVIQAAHGIIAGYDDFEAVAISTAGQVDSVGGFIRYANQNIPGYTGTNLRKIFVDAFHVPVFVENDVYAAAIGEATYGAGKNFRDFLCLTYGTGIGGAIVRDGEIYKGASYAAGEFGRMITHAEKHGDRLSGYYEANASTSVLVSKVMAVRPDLQDGRAIFANLDDETVKNFVDHWVNEIVYGLIGLINAFNPPLIVMGGGIMGNADLLDMIRAKVKCYNIADVLIVAAELLNDAGLWGVYHLARKTASAGERLRH